MGIIRNSTNFTNVIVGGQAKTGVIVDGVNRLEGGATAFTLANAGIFFTVTEEGIITLTINQGTLVDTNYTNGQNIGPNNGTITLTGEVRVPDSDNWTNANSLISITGISAVQVGIPQWSQDTWTGIKPTGLNNAGTQLTGFTLGKCIIVSSNIS